jgi:hypothetical protein
MDENSNGKTGLIRLIVHTPFGSRFVSIVEPRLFRNFFLSILQFIMPTSSSSPRKIIGLVTAAVAATAIGCVEGRQHQQQQYRRGLEKKLFDNHDHEQKFIANNMPEEINVDPRFTYNEKFMALMNSPCRPEEDGFFGATFGDPVRVQYGFQIEIEPLAPIMDILDVIEDKVVDSILMNAFPKMCGFERRTATRGLMGGEDGAQKSSSSSLSSRKLNHVEGHPSGFRFMKFEEVGKFGYTCCKICLLSRRSSTSLSQPHSLLHARSTF